MILIAVNSPPAFFVQAENIRYPMDDGKTGRYGKDRR
jgi:hypothetical protein